MMSLWTIYDHPRDFPEHFVARRWEVLPSGVRPTESYIQATDLDLLRELLLTEMHLTPLPRDPEDDPKIIETWI